MLFSEFLSQSPQPPAGRYRDRHADKQAASGGIEGRLSVLERKDHEVLEQMNRWMYQAEDQGSHRIAVRRADTVSLLRRLRQLYPALRFDIERGAGDIDNDDDNEGERGGVWNAGAACVTVKAYMDMRYNELLRLGVQSEDVYRLYELRASDSNGGPGAVEICQGMDKTSRTKVYQAVALADRMLDLKTLDATTGGGVKVISVTKKANKKRKLTTTDENRGSDILPCFLHFTLHKRSTEHLHAVQQIASALQLSSSDICHAGIKDKRALTFQRCSINTSTCSAHLTPTQIVSRLTERFSGTVLGSSGASPLVSVGNFSFQSSPLQTGQLWGNRFFIRIRRIRCTSVEVTSQELIEIIQRRKASLVQKGFLNMFGTQRTGECQSTSSVLFRYRHNHCDSLEQYEELLLASVRDHSAVGPRIGKLLIMCDFKAAFELILLGEIHTDTSTRDILKKDDTGPIAAARQLYLLGAAIGDVISAFPQYCVRERTLLRGLQRYGTDAFESALLLLPHSSRTMYINAYQSLLWNTVAAHRARVSCSVQLGDLVMKQNGIDSLHVLNQADVESGSYDIDKVVLPLFGSTVEYPSLSSINGRFYNRLLRQEGVYAIDSSGGCVQPKGAYRRLIQRLERLDIDMEDMTTERGKDDSSPSSSHGHGSMSLSFDLPAGSFATTLISCLFYNECFL